jgi:NAD(P)-dependent dehydrogenase (short-subunit alcohol dehydrogenase family)
MTGSRIIVTGATNGVGLATARTLTQAGAQVIMAVRNTELGAQRAAAIGGDTSVVELDLADLSSVRSFPDRLAGDVDILINNAGAVIPKQGRTVDGFETTLGTNFLGPFALTNLLYRRIRSKIITVASDTHKTATLDLDDPHYRWDKWSSYPAYARSKLAVMLWGLELDRRLRAVGSPVSAYLTHPGWVASNITNVSQTRAMAAFHAVAKAAAGVLANDVDAGAAPTLYCITEPIPPGSYVGIDSRLGLKGGPTLSGRSAAACDYADAARLWRFAEQETRTSLTV